MNGVVVSVKGRYAVLLNKNGEFVKVKNKNYLVGDKIKMPQYRGQILSIAASVIVVCGGISSYFLPAKYISVDINPSLMMTINIYNRVIDAKPLNNDAQVLLSETDVNGMSVSDCVDELIKKSEEIGYLNWNNKDVIVEVVEGIGKIKLPNKNYGDVEVIIENADKTDLKNAKTMGVSIAKAKAIAEYTQKNGGSIEENAGKLENKSVKEIRRKLEDKVEVKSEIKTEVEQKGIPVQKVESRIVQKNQLTVTAKYDNNTVIKNADNSNMEDKTNNIFDESIAKTTFNPIKEENKDEFVFISEKNNTKVEELIEEPIQEDKSDRKNEKIVPSETVKPVVSEKTIEQKKDKITEKVRKQPTYGGNIKPNNKPSDSNKKETSNEDETDKPNNNIQNQPIKTDKGEEKPQQDNTNNQPQEPQNPNKPFEDTDTPQKNNQNNRPQEPIFDSVDENKNKADDNPQPPIENDKPPQEPNGGNNKLPDINEPTGPSESNGFGDNKNENPSEHNKDFSMPPSESPENDNRPMQNDMPNFDGE